MRRKARLVKTLAKTNLNYGFDLAPEVEKVKRGLLRNRLKRRLNR